MTAFSRAAGGSGGVTLDTAQTITGLKTISPSAADAVGVIVKGLAAQTGDLQRWQTSAGASLVSVSSGGGVVAQSLTLNGNLSCGGGNISGVSTITVTNANVNGAFAAVSQAAATTPVIARAAASQTADIQRWQDSGAANLSRMDRVGRFIVTAAAPALADLVDGETALTRDAAGNLVVTSRVAGVLKTGTVNVL